MKSSVSGETRMTLKPESMPMQTIGSRVGHRSQHLTARQQSRELDTNTRLERCLSGLLFWFMFLCTFFTLHTVFTAGDQCTSISSRLRAADQTIEYLNVG